MTSTSEALPEVLARVPTSRGEIALRRVGEHFEIISNGVFLMDSRSGDSERLLIRSALDALAADSADLGDPTDPTDPADSADSVDRAGSADRAGSVELLIGGLGIGFSLREATGSARLRTITVVELEPAIVAWHGTHLRRFSGTALADPRVELVTADVVAWLTTTERRFDAICLDVDNGPDWTVSEHNAALYTDSGLAMLRSRLRPAGVLAIWSANPVPEFARRMRGQFATVFEHQVPVPRGEPDVVYVGALKPRPT